MTRTRSISFLAGAAAVPLAALAVAGCGGSGGGGNGAATASAPPANTSNVANSQSPTLHTAQSRLGKILVDSHGRTLYMFKKDSPTKSACSGACATAWPPLRAHGQPKAGNGVKASLLKTIKRSDGAAQVTYNGHPLYTFVMDKKAGDTNGEGVTAFGGTWFVVSAAGQQISRQAASPAPATPPAAKQPSPRPASPPAPAKPKPQPKPSSSNGIPQNGGGDGDADNNGGPDDGDGGV
jgi:predicted lipoprotein with Yx(FWY)xxD motif